MPRAIIQVTHRVAALKAETCQEFGNGFFLGVVVLHDEQAAGGKLRAHRAPHVRDLVHVVLPQHVKRAHQVGVVASELETAELKTHTAARRKYPLRVNL